tara:strand:+ start:246 stop:677 length:432 start_codon:yes stop_codon:yes gene_type:complete
MSESLVKRLSTRKCFSINENDNVITIINILTKNNIGSLPVLNSKKQLVGIVSERDIIQKIALEKNDAFFNKKAKSLMTSPVISCGIEARSDELMMIMTDNKIRHIPIVNNNKLIGMVSIGDVVNRIIEKYQSETNLLKEYIRL